MAGLVFVSPGEFTDPSDLPTVPPTPVVPVRGAMIDWAADRLNVGVVPSWTDMLGARTLEAPANPPQYPVATGVGPDRRVVFDGSNDRMLAVMNIDQPCTLVVVARSVNAAASDIILTGFNTQTWNLAITQGSVWAFSTGSGSTILGPPADTDWHTFIVSVNGGSSVMSVDGAEVSAPIDPVSWKSVSVGSAASFYSAVELKRLAVIPRATTSIERESIRKRLATHYGL